MMRLMAALAVLALVAPGIADAQQLANRLFGAHDTAAPGPARAIGSYARGCGQGFVQLPETGPTWQAMRLSRNRNWGHPEMIDYLVWLSGEAARLPGWRGLYIGDISQPRGGPMTSGHSSHQIGLDADIWFLPAARLTLSRRDRETISSVSVRTADQRGLTSHWTAQHARLLQIAASDPRVDRIFVAAAVKIELCRTATPADRAWLQRIRPFSGHNYHFHVRLRCPGGSPHCQTQAPTVAELSQGGDGCDETLEWWVTEFLEPPPRRPRDPSVPRPRHPREFTLADLPAQCAPIATTR